MNVQIVFATSVAFSFVAWGLCAASYAWPRLRLQSRADALRPLLILHTFRFVGLSFLVPGVVANDLPAAFALEAGLGDLVAAGLALVALAGLRASWGTAAAWIFNVWGAADLINAFFRAFASGLVLGQFGATFFIPTLIVPMLMITHGIVFALLLRADPRPMRVGSLSEKALSRPHAH